MPEVDTLRVKALWWPRTTRVIELPTPSWRTSALTNLTVLMHGQIRASTVAEPLSGKLTLTVPASLALKELVLHAKTLRRTFEASQRSAGVLDCMRLVCESLESFSAGAMDEGLKPRGLCLPHCLLPASALCKKPETHLPQFLSLWYIPACTSRGVAWATLCMHFWPLLPVRAARAGPAAWRSWSEAGATSSAECAL